MTPYEFTKAESGSVIHSTRGRSKNALTWHLNKDTVPLFLRHHLHRGRHELLEIPATWARQGKVKGNIFVSSFRNALTRFLTCSTIAWGTRAERFSTFRSKKEHFIRGVLEGLKKWVCRQMTLYTSQTRCYGQKGTLCCTWEQTAHAQEKN